MTGAGGVPEPAAEAVAAYLAERIGLRMAGARRSHLVGEIAGAMGRAGAVSAEGYRAQLEEDETAFAALVARVTVGESYFFREPHQLEVLRSTILPERLATRGASAGLRLWSAGCSIGQEAYTLAMLLEEEGLAANSRILATDLSREALRVAREGIYGKWSLRAVTDGQRDAYFHPVVTGYRVDERLGASITFREMNLLDPPESAPRGIDVILCRNVLIYFTPEAIGRAARQLAAALAPGGWLVTGSSDPSFDGVEGLQPTSTAAGIVYRQLATPAAEVAGPRAPVIATRATRRAPHPAVESAPLARPERVRPERVRPTAPSAAAPPRGEHEESADGAVHVVRRLGGAGELAAALDAAADAVRRFPMHTELRYLEAIVLLEAGRPSDAAASARAALYLDPALVMAHLALARAEAALGERNRARRSLHNAAELLARMPDDAPVPMSDGEPASRLSAMAAAHDRALVG